MLCHQWVERKICRGKGRHRLQPEYQAAFEEWMWCDPCAALLAMLERRICAGQSVAAACWCETPLFCHRALLGFEMDRRGLEVIFG
jgi:hypothetical protein